MQAKSKEMYFKIMVREKKRRKKEWVVVGGQSSSKQLSIVRLCYLPLFFYEIKTQNDWIKHCLVTFFTSGH